MGAIDEFYDPEGKMAAEESKEALKSAAKDESTELAQEQPTPSAGSRETPEITAQKDLDSESDLEEELYSYVGEYISPQSDEVGESERESKRQRRE